MQWESQQLQLGIQDAVWLVCHLLTAVWCNPLSFTEENLYSTSPLRCSVVFIEREKKNRNLTGAHYVKPDIFIPISDAPWGNFPHRVSCILSLCWFDPVTLGYYLKNSWLHQYYIRQKDHIQSLSTSKCTSHWQIFECHPFLNFPIFLPHVHEVCEL